VNRKRDRKIAVSGLSSEPAGRAAAGLKEVIALLEHQRSVIDRALSALRSVG
jgi:hypothetical protein